MISLHTPNFRGIRHVPYGDRNKRTRKQARKYWRFRCDDYCAKKLALMCAKPRQPCFPRPIERTPDGFKIYGYFDYGNGSEDWGWLFYEDGQAVEFRSDVYFKVFGSLHITRYNRYKLQNWFRENDVSSTRADDFDDFCEQIGRRGMPLRELVICEERFDREIIQWRIRHENELRERWRKQQDVLADIRQISNTPQCAANSARQLRALGFVA